MELNSNVADVDGPRLFQAERSKPMAFLLPLTRCLIFGASSVCGLTPRPKVWGPGDCQPRGGESDGSARCARPGPRPGNGEGSSGHCVGIHEGDSLLQKACHVAACLNFST